ncbi:MAG: arginine deiminase family protein [Acidobacteriales bacterium]|nr:arginine deiminase family protein [Terriglobales bacterium]
MAYDHAPNYAAASAEHVQFCRVLEDAGAEVIQVPHFNAATLDAVYVHDPSFVTDQGVILLRMGRESRSGETEAHRALYTKLDIPILGAIKPPGTVEAGDIVWLDKKTLLVGEGYRTNADGIRQITDYLAPFGVEVLTAPLPHASGPLSCLHLMSLMSLLDERTALVDLPWLAVSTVQLLQTRGFRLIEIEASERNLLACNVLALGGGRLLAFAESSKTGKKLAQAGFQVFTVPGSEIGINGGGGPTCLTRPILRK